MTDDRRDKVHRLLEALAESLPDHRRALLEGLEPELRDEVESLLSSQWKAINGDGTNATSRRSPDDEDEWPTKNRLQRDSAFGIGSGKPAGQIGPYRILREVGRGGMGTVYEAEQQEPRRSVAVKVIRGEAYLDEHHVRLFQREGQALARLKHPGIAGIYEAGRTEDGHHFFAMELVTGENLSTYLSNRSSDAPSKRELRATLELFVKICEAVNYAHQRGVIHRDLKPSNIIVSTDGDASSSIVSPQIKILDFGLARITDPEADDLSSMTAIGRIQGTLPYMSPEQTRGHPADIDLRSDVYSLGVLLYEMVTGVRPYQVDPAAPLEAIRVICEQEPKTPRASSSRALDPDLETILLKALEKDPACRYQSALALAEDVQRYLAGRPILAHPPSTVYQLKKLVSRHKVGFGFVAAFFLLVLGFAIVATVQSARIVRERDRAEQEAKTSREVSDFLVELFEVSDPSEARGNSITAREILDQSASKLANLDDQPEIRSRLRSTIGKVYMNLGLFEGAETLLKQALDTQRDVLGNDHPATLATINDLANLYFHQQRPADAEPFYLEVVNARTLVLGEEHPDTLRAQFDLASLYVTLRRLDEAKELTETTLGSQRRVLGDNHLDVAGSLNNLGAVFLLTARLEEAEPLFREALSIVKSQRGRIHPDVVAGTTNLARLLAAKKDYVESERLYRESLSILGALYDDPHPNRGYTLSGLALVLDEKGDSSSAEPLHAEACEVFDETLGPDSWITAECQSHHGHSLWKLKRFEQAEDKLVSAHAVLLAQLGSEHDRTQRAAARLVELYDAWGKPEKAAEYRFQTRRVEER